MSPARELLLANGSVDEAKATLLVRVRGEFLEMPGLRLTRVQAARLWHVEVAVASSLLQALVDSHFLTVRNGQYARPAV